MRHTLLLLLVLISTITFAQHSSCESALEEKTCGINFGNDGLFVGGGDVDYYAFTATDISLTLFLGWSCDPAGQTDIAEFLNVYPVFYQGCEEEFWFVANACQDGPEGEFEMILPDQFTIGEDYIIAIESCEQFECEYYMELHMENSGQVEYFFNVVDPYFEDGCQEPDFEQHVFCPDRSIRFRTEEIQELAFQYWSIFADDDLASDSQVSWSTLNGTTGVGGDVYFEDEPTEFNIVFNQPGTYSVCFEEVITACTYFEGDCIEVEVLDLNQQFYGEICAQNDLDGFIPTETNGDYSWIGAPIYLEELVSGVDVVERVVYTDECDCLVYQTFEYRVSYPGDNDCLAEEVENCPNWDEAITIEVENELYTNLNQAIVVQEDKEVTVKTTIDGLSEGRIDWYVSNDLDFTPGEGGQYLSSSSITTDAVACENLPEMLAIQYYGTESYVLEHDRSVESELLILSTGSGFNMDELYIGTEEETNTNCPNECLEANFYPKWANDAARFFDICGQVVGVGAGDQVPPNSVLIVLFGPEEPDNIWQSEYLCNLGVCVYVTRNDCNRCFDAFTNSGGRKQYELITECGTNSITYPATNFRGQGSYYTKEGFYFRAKRDELPSFLFPSTEKNNSMVGDATFSLPCDVSDLNVNGQNLFVKGLLVNADLQSCCDKVLPTLNFLYQCGFNSDDELRWADNSADFLPSDLLIETEDCPLELDLNNLSSPTYPNQVWSASEVAAVSSCGNGATSIGYQLDGVELVSSQVVGQLGEGVYSLSYYARDDCNNYISHSYTLTITCKTDTPDEIFSEYPWLSDVVNMSDCGAITVHVYTQGIYAFVYVEESGTGVLYFQDGTLYCTDAPGFSCVDAYGFGAASDTWICDGPGGGGNGDPSLEEDYPWMTDYIDFDDCNGFEVTFYDFYGTRFPYFEANGRMTLFSDMGQVYCTDSPPGFICPEVYNLGTPLSTWICGETCTCPDVFDPVCGDDGLTYENACEAECAGVGIAFLGECNPVSDPPIFTEYPWLYDLYDPYDCEEDATLTVFRSGAYYYIYYKSASVGELYNSEGLYYCGDFPNFSCPVAYGFTADNIVDQWSCDGFISEAIVGRSKKAALESLSFECYPNPTTSIVNISLESRYEGVALEVKVMNMKGQILMQEQWSGNSEFRFDLQEFEKGIYLIELRSKEQSAIKKLIRI